MGASAPAAFLAVGLLALLAPSASAVRTALKARDPILALVEGPADHHHISKAKFQALLEEIRQEPKKEEEAKDKLELLQDTAIATGVVSGVLVLFALFLELVTDRCEASLERGHWAGLIHKVYKELMILGALSVFLFLEERYELVELFVNQQYDKELFQHMHMILCLVLSVYIIVVICLAFYTNHLYSWFMDIEKRRDEIESEWQSYSADAGPGVERSCSARCCHPSLLFEHQYLSMRASFLEQETVGLAGRNDFPFYLYLRKCMRDVSVVVAGIDADVWASMFIFVFLQTIRAKAFVEGTKGVDYGAVGFIWATFLFAVFLWWKTKSTLGEVCEQYSDVATTHVLSTEHGPDLIGQAAGTHDLEDEAARLGMLDGDEEAQHAPMVVHDGAVCCGCGDPSPQEALFWCARPSRVVHGIQFCVLSVSLALAMWGVLLWEEFGALEVDDAMIFNLVSLLPLLAMLFWLVPAMIPRLVLASSVGSMYRRQHIDATITKVRRLMRKGLAPDGKTPLKSGYLADKAEERGPTHWKITQPRRQAA